MSLIMIIPTMLLKNAQLFCFMLFLQKSRRERFLDSRNNEIKEIKIFGSFFNLCFLLLLSLQVNNLLSRSLKEVILALYFHILLSYFLRLPKSLLFSLHVLLFLSEPPIC